MGKSSEKQGIAVDVRVVDEPGGSRLLVNGTNTAHFFDTRAARAFALYPASIAVVGELVTILQQGLRGSARGPLEEARAKAALASGMALLQEAQLRADGLAREKPTLLN